MRLIILSLFIFQLSSAAEVEVNQKCGDKPNCISSFDERKSYYFEPLKDVDGTWSDIKAKIISNLESFTNAKVVSEKENFIHLVVSTKIMKYKDDLNFWWNPQTKTLSFKSESRVGYWDLGANRKRMNRFVKNWKN